MPTTTPVSHAWLSGRRLAAELAILALLAMCALDFVIGAFWQRHAMLTSIGALLLVALVSEICSMRESCVSHPEVSNRELRSGIELRASTSF